MLLDWVDLTEIQKSYKHVDLTRNIKKTTRNGFCFARHVLKLVGQSVKYRGSEFAALYTQLILRAGTVIIFPIDWDGALSHVILNHL